MYQTNIEPCKVNNLSAAGCASPKNSCCEICNLWVMLRLTEINSANKLNMIGAYMKLALKLSCF
jgi:hypothetical protein